MEDLTRTAIIDIDDLVIEEVKVPGWNGVVYLRTLTGIQRDEFEQLATDRHSAKHFDIRGMKIRLVCMSLCDKTGKVLFGGRDDDKILNAKSGATIDRLFKIAQRLSALSDADLEEMTSDLTGGPNASSGSD